jgi:hypothetical protein
MARINFTFERWETDAPHGFELGDLTVATDSRSVTSKGRIPDAKMMIYISIADLISGVAALLRGNSRQYEFVGVDSSFSLSFKRTKRGVELKQGTKELGLFDPRALAAQVAADVDRFWNAHPLSPDDAVFDDIKSSREQLQKALAA